MVFITSKTKFKSYLRRQSVSAVAPVVAVIQLFAHSSHLSWNDWFW